MRGINKIGKKKKKKKPKKEKTSVQIIVWRSAIELLCK